MTTENSVLRLENIHKSFGAVAALTDVSFEVNAGEIHALAGENGAGKSTLTNIIGGVYAADSGSIMMRGERIKIGTPLQAQRSGISLVHQEIALCPDVSVAENVLMSEIGSQKSMFMNYTALRDKAKETLRLLTDIKPETILGSLSISSQQLVEICRALTLDCSVLILDEPTAALTQKEADALFDILRSLREKGMAIIYISHRMSEIYKICDRITVLRDGRNISTDQVAETTPDQIVHNLLGRHIEATYTKKRDCQSDGTIMRVEELCDGEFVESVSFELKRGEILGISGLIGSGRSELLHCICGLRQRTSGRVTLADDQDFSVNSYSESVEAGVVCLSEDRKIDGVFLELPITFNMSSMDLEKVSTSYKFIDRHKERSQATELGQLLNLKHAKITQRVEDLSGGNQQKVAIAKILSVKPRILLMDEPTRGIDVGAKAEIHRLLRELADDGIGVIVVSSELAEVTALCDRVLVMSEGRMTGILGGSDVTEDNLVGLAAGSKNKLLGKDVYRVQYDQ